MKTFIRAIKKQKDILQKKVQVVLNKVANEEKKPKKEN